MKRGITDINKVDHCETNWKIIVLLLKKCQKLTIKRNWRHCTIRIECTFNNYFERTFDLMTEPMLSHSRENVYTHRSVWQHITSQRLFCCILCFAIRVVSARRPVSVRRQYAIWRIDPLLPGHCVVGSDSYWNGVKFKSAGSHLESRQRFHMRRSSYNSVLFILRRRQARRVRSENDSDADHQMVSIRRDCLVFIGGRWNGKHRRSLWTIIVLRILFFFINEKRKIKITTNIYIDFSNMGVLSITICLLRFFRQTLQ